MSRHTLHLFTPVEIAEELALRDAELLRRIGPREIRNGAWMDKDRVRTSYIIIQLVSPTRCLVDIRSYLISYVLRTIYS